MSERAVFKKPLYKESEEEGKETGLKLTKMGKRQGESRQLWS